MLDTKNLRAGTYAAIIGLLLGVAFGTNGGWEPLYKLTSNIFGLIIIALAFSVALAYIYNTWFSDFLPGTALVKGAIFGILVWIVFLILGGLFNFFKEAIYPQNSGPVLFLSFVVEVIWGASLGIFSAAKP